MFDQNHKAEKKWPLCTIPWHEFLVHENGNVLLCCRRNTCIGNLEKNTFEELWHGAEAEAFRNGLITGSYYKVCQDCKFIHPENPENFKNSALFK